jgi:hypothetical protein
MAHVLLGQLGGGVRVSAGKTKAKAWRLDRAFHNFKVNRSYWPDASDLCVGE